MLKDSIKIRAFVFLITLVTGSLLSPGISLAVTPQVAAGGYHTVGLKADGTVVAVGWNIYGQCDVDSWTGIQQVTVGDWHTVGLQADGTVIAVGLNDDEQCEVDDWDLMPGPSLSADFSASPTSGPAPLRVNFTDQSTGDITSWSWDFGDGATSTEQNPSHTYTDAGTYTVSLTVTGLGGSDTEVKANFITVLEQQKAMPWVPLLLLDD